MYKMNYMTNLTVSDEEMARMLQALLCTSDSPWHGKTVTKVTELETGDFEIIIDDI